tara:strand:+ start:263 stop:682 length:420 start_codon:yes stop_codon:yes gene_type:complete
MKKKLNDMKTIILKKIKQKKGNIVKIIKKDDTFFYSFGELYVSEIKPHQTKAWRYHKRSTQNIFLLEGRCKIVCQLKKRFVETQLSENSPKLIIIPKKCWYGFKNKSRKKVKLLNLCDRKFSENEILRKEIKEIKYNWQ